MLNLTAAGPGAFVGAYLDALARRDAASALAMPGVHPGTGDTQLLGRGRTARLSGIRQVDDVAHDGMHRITMAWTSAGGSGETAFEVRPAGTRLGVVSAWEFAESPVAELSLEVQNTRTFDVGTITAGTPGGPADYAVLVPGVYTIGHTSTFLDADPVRVTADTVGQDLSAVVDVEANAHFVNAVETQVDKHLRQCTNQQVLFPTGCPFGEQIDNRVVSAPQWSMVALSRRAAGGRGRRCRLERPGHPRDRASEGRREEPVRRDGVDFDQGRAVHGQLLRRDRPRRAP